MENDEPLEPALTGFEESPDTDEFDQPPARLMDHDDDSENEDDFQDPIELITEFGNNPLMER